MKRMLLLLAVLSSACMAQSIDGCKVSANPYDPNSTSNPFGRCGSQFSPDSINNPFGKYGSPFSPNSVSNPYATDAPSLKADDGTYLGRYSSNTFDPDSTSNSFGQYGSQFSPDSINNPFSPYGSSFSPYSTTNPYATDAPTLSDDNDDPE